MALPKQVKYSDIKPLGVPTDVRYMKFTPQTAFGVINNSDQLRFQINSPGFWDPYSAYITMEVDLSSSDANVFYQIDGSGHSLINELVISCGGKELERIQEYDTLADFLADMSYSPEMRLNRQHEGSGYKVFNNNGIFAGGFMPGNSFGQYKANYTTPIPVQGSNLGHWGLSEQIDYGSDPFFFGKRTTAGDGGYDQYGFFTHGNANQVINAPIYMAGTGGKNTSTGAVNLTTDGLTCIEPFLKSCNSNQVAKTLYDY